MRIGPYRSFYLPESSPHYPPRKDFHTEHVRIELALDFKKHRLSGSCLLTVVPLRDGLSKLSLDACEMEIQNVAVDGENCPYDYDNEKLTLNLLKPLSGKHLVLVDYSAEPREGVYFVEPDEEYPDKMGQVWTHNQSDFARYWYPCFDHPGEKSTSELVLTVPKGFIVVSNGKLVESTEEGDTTTFHWKEDLPHSSYLTSFVAGPFAVMEQESEGVKLQYYFPASKRADVLRYFGETPKMIKVFNELTGVRYPFSKYSQSTVEDFIFGGMENFNATTLAMSYYPDKDSEEDFQTSYSAQHTNAVNLVAHELAHQWFGDLATCADWSHAWLNEGFATYMQGLYLERTRGVDTFRWDLRLRAEEFFEEDETEYRRRIVEKNYVYPDDLFDFATYERGAWMIHELRYMLGDAVFFKGIREYLKAQSFASVDTHDFRRAIEKSSGVSLEEFFEQAFFSPGYPEFTVDYSWDEDAKIATVRVRQTQKLEMETPVFKLPCDLVFYVGGKRDKRRVMVTTADQTFSVGLSSKPSIVEFDPEHWLLKKLRFKKSLQLLAAQLESSADASSRSDAARDLGETKSNLALPALVGAAEREEFWEVNARAIVAIGEVGTKEALDALLDIGFPRNRRTRRALAEALGKFKDARVRDPLTKLLKSDESPYVRCEAALSLAKAWPEGAFGILREAMKIQSANWTLTEACLEAMGKLKDDGVKQIIRERLRYGEPGRTRIGALKAIKERGVILDDEVPVLKEILLRDKEFRVRLFLVGRVIPTLGDRRFIEEVREASKSDKDPRVKRKALEVYYDLSEAAEASGAITRLRREVDELKEKNAELAKGS